MYSYDNNQILARGSFATVFSGFRNSDRLPVAVKKITLNNNPNKSLESLRIEIDIHNQLKHPNIVELFFSEQNDQEQALYLYLELMNQGDLFDALYVKFIKFDSNTCFTMMQDIVAGLTYLHEQGFIHRDIKPENILLNDRWQAKLADFGLSSSKETALTTDPLGTPEYIAPEIASIYLKKAKAKQYAYNELTDIYALGLTLLEMVGSPKPFYDYKKSGNKIQFWEKIAEGLSSVEIPEDKYAIFSDVIKGCLIQNPKNRINNQALNQLLSISWAAQNGYDDVVSFFIKQGADINLVTQFSGVSDPKYNHFSPLDWALASGHLSTSTILMEAGAIANHLPSMENDIREGNLRWVQFILQCNPAFINKIDQHGYALIHYAVFCNQIQILRHLIAQEANINIESTNHYTALDLALENQTLDPIALFLVDAGAVITSAVDGKSHVIHLAAANGRLDLVKTLIQIYPNLIDVKDNSHRTALSWAAAQGHDEIVAFLIKNGADLDHIDSNNYSALDRAIENKNSGCILILMRSNARANYCMKQADTHRKQNYFLFFNQTKRTHQAQTLEENLEQLNLSS